MIACAFWTMGYGMALAAVNVQGRETWLAVMVLGIATVPTSWLLLALAYAGHERLLSTGRVLLFLIEPIAVTAEALTNRWNHLWSPETVVARVGQAALLRPAGGIGYWGHLGYTYLVFLIGLILLLRQLPRAGGVRRRQIIGLVVGALIPFISHVVGTMVWNPFEPLDPTAFAFATTGIVFALVFMRSQALDMIPVASGLATENMGDGMLVLDRDDRVTYINPAAERITGHTSADCIGREVSEILSDVETGDVVRGGSTNYPMYQIGTTPLRSVRGKHRGRLLILSDVTERKRLHRNGVRGSRS